MLLSEDCDGHVGYESMEFVMIMPTERAPRGEGRHTTAGERREWNPDWRVD